MKRSVTLAYGAKEKDVPLKKQKTPLPVAVEISDEEKTDEYEEEEPIEVCLWPFLCPHNCCSGFYMANDNYVDYHPLGLPSIPLDDHYAGYACNADM